MDYDYWLLISALVGLLYLSARLWGTTFRRATQPHSKLSQLSAGLRISFVAFGMTCLATDVAMEIFSVRTDFFGFTRPAQRWWMRYWHPVNSFGYRDEEYSAGYLSGKRIMVILGDSIVAGQGIERVEDRFSNRLAQSLGAEWRVLNVAKCGWSTSDELIEFRNHARQWNPERVVVSYYINDIEGALRAGNHPPAPTPFRPRGIFGGIIDHLNLPNFVYWTAYRFFIPSFGRDYWEATLQEGSRSAVWSKHAEELRELFSLIRDRNPLLVLNPELQDLSLGNTHLSQVTNVAVEEKIPFLDLRTIYRGLDLFGLQIGRFDSHPNQRAHQLIFQAIEEFYRDRKGS